MITIIQEHLEYISALTFLPCPSTAMKMVPNCTTTCFLRKSIPHRQHQGFTQLANTSCWQPQYSQRWTRSITTQASLATSKPIVFSGIQPTGVPHLGNYLGALREWVRLQDNTAQETKLFFSIVDLHALTLPQDAKQLRRWRKESLATLLSIGLDPTRSTIFFQSAVSMLAFSKNRMRIR